MRGRSVIAAVFASLLMVTSAFAQGGGASSTGTIQGKVADAQGGVLPGVTVTATSPAMMGAQVQVTNESGSYRFPAVPPGKYSVSYELPGFNTLKRENIDIALGFTATLNVELQVASLQESVTVTGDAPVVDTSNTRVQQNFKLEALQQIPNSRDLWALLAVTPAVTMGRTDVGGNRAGTQTGYTAYGYSGQNRVLVEGINTTEGTSGAGFYVDYGSFEEVFLGTIGQGAEMPTPGVQSQMLGKSGGNKFQGEIYQDYESNGFQSGNIPQDVATKAGILLGSNEILKYRDSNINLGGPIKKDKLWWYFSYRNQKTAVGQPNFIGPIAGKSFDTLLWNPSGKATYLLSQNNKFIGYYQWGQKEQPNRLPSGSFSYTDAGSTISQLSGSWIYKGEWNGTLNNNTYVEARYGVFGYYFPLIANTDTKSYQIVDNFRSQYFNGDQKEQTDRQRKQLTGAMTYFKDGMAGTHNFKIGGELLLESGWFGYTQVASGNVRETIGSTGTPTQVILYAPTALKVGSLGDGPNGNLLSISKLDTYDAFVSDTWNIGRLTMNLGLRWDHYKSWTPEQRQLAYSFGPLSIGDKTFAEQTYATWDIVVPRLGMTYDLTGKGRTVVKANWGLFGFNPGVGLASSANGNQSVKSVTYAWTDTKVCAGCIPGDFIYQPGEEGAQTASALAGNVQVDPNLAQPKSTQATVFLEHQLMEGLGMRAGFVYFTVKNQFNTYQPYRPASAYTAPFTFVDRGADGVVGTADDANLTFYGIPNATVASFPNTQVVSNMPDDGTYKTVEFSLNKRMSHNFSASGGFGYTWQHDFPGAIGAPNTPNGPFDADYSTYSFKGNATYQFPAGITASMVYRFTAGSNYARTLSVSAPASCACTFSAARGASLTNTTVFATPYNAYRQDNIQVVDIRVEKTQNLGSLGKVRLFFDLFNIANKYAAETIVQSTGTTFQNPTAILGPRTARIGVRFQW